MKPQAYILDLDPTKCAEMYCDQHVMEDLPMLIEVLRAANVADPAREPLCKHVLVKWAMAKDNYTWLRKLILGLMLEQQYRFGMVDEEAATAYWVLPRWPESQGIPRFLQLIPTKVPGDTVSAYRQYYNNQLVGAAWTRRKVPTWWTGVSQDTLNFVTSKRKGVSNVRDNRSS